MNTHVWTVALIAVVILFQIVALPALLLKKNDLADVLWGPAFPLTAFAALMWGGDFQTLDQRTTAILALITIWAIRLFWHVGVRNLSTRHEDIRYNNWRQAWGKTWVWRSWLQVFVLQPLILYVFLTPVLLAISSPSQPMGPIAWVGVVVWFVAVLLETVADAQLKKFKSNPANKGKLMMRGVWSWSRHPNYFGEVLSWWGIWLMVLDLPYGWATIIGPIGVTYLILKVSGVPMLEDLMRTRPGFDEYARKTSIFVPLPPRYH